MTTKNSNLAFAIDLEHDQDKVFALYTSITCGIDRWLETPLLVSAAICNQRVGDMIEQLEVLALGLQEITEDLNSQKVLANTLENVRQELDRVNEQIAQHEATNQ